ncbi:Uncharacterised protein [uncultured archaeon]|nr:Uncharacterised protein [uncultured archaeon]
MTNWIGEKLSAFSGPIDLKKALLTISIALILITLAGGCKAASPIWPATASNPIGFEEENTSFSYEANTQGNGYSMNYMYAQAGNVELKNYAHGSGSINNEAVLTYQNLSRRTHNAYSDYNDFDQNCIQFKEDNVMTYAPMRIAVGNGYYAASPLDYSSLLKEKTWARNYRAGTSMHHEVEYAHALNKELEITAKEVFNYTYDPEKKGDGYTKMNINEDVTDGKAHIGVLKAGKEFSYVLGRTGLTGDDVLFTVGWKEPSIDIDEDFFGTYHIERNITLDVPYYLKQSSDDWLPCCYGGFSSMTSKDQGYLGKSTKGIFDCTCFKAPTQAQFPRSY